MISGVVYLTDYYIELRNIDFDDDNSEERIEYHFKLISNLDSNNNLPVTTVEGDQPLNNQHLAFQGKGRIIPINWVVYNNDSDKSNGTYSTSGITDSRISNSNIKTVTEQKVYLERYIHSSNNVAEWRLFGGEFSDPDGDGTDEGTPVVVETCNVRRTNNNPLTAQGVMKLRVGQRV